MSVRKVLKVINNVIQDAPYFELCPLCKFGDSHDTCPKKVPNDVKS